MVVVKFCYIYVDFKILYLRMLILLYKFWRKLGVVYYFRIINMKRKVIYKFRFLYVFEYFKFSLIFIFLDIFSWEILKKKNKNEIFNIRSV